MSGLHTTSVAAPQRRRACGFSLFEFAVVVCIFGVLLTVLLQRVAFYRRAGDQAGVQALLVNLRSALSGKVIALQAQGREREIEALAGANPVQWLDRAPDNYAGELGPEAAKNVKDGNWYFDSMQHKLVFVRQPQGDLLNSASKNIYFKVESLRLPEKNANAQRQPVAEAGVALNEVAQ